MRKLPTGFVSRVQQEVCFPAVTGPQNKDVHDRVAVTHRNRLVHLHWQDARHESAVRLLQGERIVPLRPMGIVNPRHQTPLERP